MNCKTAHKIMIYYSGVNPESSKYNDFRIHLNNCESCSKIFSEIEETFSLIENRNQLESNPYLFFKLLDRLKRNSENVVVQQVFSNFKSALQPAFFLLIFIFSIIGGIKIGSISKKPQNNISEQNTIEYYFNDINQETVEVLLLNE